MVLARVSSSFTVRTKPSSPPLIISSPVELAGSEMYSSSWVVAKCGSLNSAASGLEP